MNTSLILTHLLVMGVTKNLLAAIYMIPVTEVAFGLLCGQVVRVQDW